MDKNTLIDRITKKEAQIEKIKRRINKWKNQCSDKEIDIAEKYRDSYPQYVKYCKESNIDYSYTPMLELHSALQDLDEALATLNKYKNQLDIIVDREKEGKIPVLEEFFKHYREGIIKFVESNAQTLHEYFHINKERINFKNYKRQIMREENLTEDEYLLQLNRLKEKEDELSESIHPITKSVYSRSSDNYIDIDELNRIIDQDVENKYYNMIEKVSKLTGEIVDASNVSIGGDGNLNGTIIGKDGKAKIETILAGGYNQNVILDSGRHGQILHYRLLVKKV